MKNPFRHPTESSINRLLRRRELLLGWKQHGRDRSREIGFHRVPSETETREDARDLESVTLKNPESHAICVAPTGTGKGRSSLIPQLLTWPGSAVVIDPKGEAAMVTGHYREQVLKQKVVYLDPFKLTTKNPGSLNPLDAIRFSGDSPEEFAIMAPGLLHPDHVSFAKEPYWDNCADALISAILCYILTCEEPDKRHFPRLRELLMTDDVVYSLAVLLDTKGKSMPPMAHGQISSFLGTADVTRSGILSTAQQHLRLLADPCVIQGLSSTCFDLDQFQRGEPMTIYLILPPTRLTSHGLLLRNWLGTLFTVAMSRERLPKTPTLFLVDEAAALGPMDQLRTAFTLLRGYGVRVMLYLQDLSQLKRLYPQDWETIVNNAGTIQAFAPSNFVMARQIAEFFGEECRPQDLLRMTHDEQFILFQGGVFERCRKLDYLNDPVFKGRFKPNPRYEQQAPESA